MCLVAALGRIVLFCPTRSGAFSTFHNRVLRVALAAAALAMVLWASGTAFPKGWAVWRALLVMGFLNNAWPPF
jgi:hypothetical protein